MRMSDPAAADAPGDDVMGDGVFRAVLGGYDAVYDALPRGETFDRLWRMNPYHGEFPEPFAHIGFLTAGEARRLHGMLHIRPSEVLVDLACGAGGPGLWMARESGSSLIGIDPSAAGLAAARQRATGVDPVADYRPLIAAAGLTIETYEETPGSEERMYAAFSAILENNDTLIAEMGERAAAAAAAEAVLTTQIKPYPRRIMAVASREHRMLARTS
jgi:hypothetical protein